uniref:SMK-1 domain-containing protein n=1 Tax=Meloidogyne hapla TaxID=6305 RepID=A0A1I8BVW2_MELHA
MAYRMNSLFKKLSFNVETSPVSVRIPQSAFQIILSAKKCDCQKEDDNDRKEHSKVELAIEPANLGEQGDGYELIVDYKLVVDSETKLIERDRWKDKEVLQEIETDSCVIDWLEFSLCSREMLGVPGGENNCVVQSLAVNELDQLLTACCAYSTPIVHRRNFDTLLEIADKEKITGLLRLLESFLVDSRVVHPIRKLEYSAEYRMTRLATSVLRSFPNRLARLDSLFAYLSENGENITDVHLDVLEMLEIKPESIVI